MTADLGRLVGPIILVLLAVLLLRKAAGVAFKMIGLIMLLVAVGAVLHGRSGQAPLEVRVLGDSYSAGNGAGDYYGPAECRRSRHNYGEVYESLLDRNGRAANLSTSACSGAVTADFTREQHRGLPAQLDDIDGQENVILLTIGGNDLYFADLVEYCLVNKTRVGNHCLDNLDRALSLLHSGTIETRIHDVLESIGTRAPHATIVLIGYPYLEGDRRFTLTDRKEGSASVANRPCGKRSGGTNIVEVGRCLTSISDLGEQVQARVVHDLNRDQGTDRFVFISTKALFAGSQPGFRGPNHELYATRVNPDRWFIQPFVDAQSGLGTAEAARYGTDVFYHPNATGWGAEGQLIFGNSRLPR